MDFIIVLTFVFLIFTHITNIESCNISIPSNEQCDKRHALWHFSSDDNRCKPFYACGGNGINPIENNPTENNFGTEGECVKSCPSAIGKCFEIFRVS